MAKGEGAIADVVAGGEKRLRMGNPGEKFAGVVVDLVGEGSVKSRWRSVLIRIDLLGNPARK